MHTYRCHPEAQASRTAHLSLMEEGARLRLLDWQYSNEVPLPPTPAERYRITRAITLAERRATDRVTAAFFGADGWSPQARERVEGERRRNNTPDGSDQRQAGPVDVAAQSTASAEASPAPVTMLPSLVAPEPAVAGAPDEVRPDGSPAPSAATPEAIAALGLKLLAPRRIPVEGIHDFLELMRKKLGPERSYELLQTCEREAPAIAGLWLHRAMSNSGGWLGNERA